MGQDNQIVALIPARAGSKRLVNKCWKEINNLPLFERSIKFAVESEKFEEIIFSSDDDDMLNIAKDKYNVTVIRRPDYLSSDTSRSVDVALHAIKSCQQKLDSSSSLCLLQPTTPFRSLKDLNNCLHIMSQDRLAQVISVSPDNHSPYRSLILEARKIAPLFVDSNFNDSHHKLIECYHANGAYYLTNIEKLINEKTFFGTNVFPYVMENSAFTLDIDNNWDLQISIAVSKLLGLD